MDGFINFVNRVGKHFDVEHIALNRSRLSRPYDVEGNSGVYSVEVYLTDLIAWTEGKLIQDAMPYLNADQREFLVSGMTPAEFEALFGED